MPERRRTPRYELGEPLRGDAMPMEDVLVERYSKDRLVVIANSAPPSNEELMIHLATSEGLASRKAEIISSHPVSVSGALCYRLELRISDPPPAGDRT
jgi:hypothetical protein